MVKQAVTFIGLGVMGHPMAGHLQRAGYSFAYLTEALPGPVSGLDAQGPWLRASRSEGE
jgi:3-hydroxyisobutyrate dehydrogenase-like beta-hydroxyacid dehydrogenase